MCSLTYVQFPDDLSHPTTPNSNTTPTSISALVRMRKSIRVPRVPLFWRIGRSRLLLRRCLLLLLLVIIIIIIIIIIIVVVVVVVYES